MSDEIVLDVGDAKTVAEVTKKAKSADAIRREGLLSLMGTEPGRKWMLHLLERCGVAQNPFTSDPHRTAFNCGEMNIGLQVVAELHDASTELYLLMMKESKNG